MEPTNYYRSSATPYTSFLTFRGAHAAKVCIIGGGFAGLNTALGLVERGMSDVVVLEAQQLAFGASGRNGGFVFAGFSRSPERLLQELGLQRARALYSGTTDAVNLIRQRIAHYSIPCQHTDAGIYWTNWFRDPQVLRHFQKMLTDSYGNRWQFVPKAELRHLIHSERYSDALFEPNAMHFHPLNYALGIAKTVQAQGVRLHEHSPAIALERQGAGWRVCTPEGEIHAEQVVLACGGYLANLRRDVDAGVLPIATYAMVTEPLGARMAEILHTSAAVYDTRFAFDYYRPLPDTRLLWGGRISIFDQSPEKVKQLLYGDLLKVFPQLKGIQIESAWSGLMSYARHEMPQIGCIDDGLWLGQAFGGHGVAPTTFAGEVLASAIAEGDTRWKEFSDYGLVSALKPAGFLGAQLNYWWLEAKDAWKAWREGTDSTLIEKTGN